MTRPSATPAAETPAANHGAPCLFERPARANRRAASCYPPLSSSLRWPRPSARLTAGGVFFFGFAHGTQGRGAGAARRSDVVESQ